MPLIVLADNEKKEGGNRGRGITHTQDPNGDFPQPGVPLQVLSLFFFFLKTATYLGGASSAMEFDLCTVWGYPCN